MRPATQRKLDLSYSQYVPRAFSFAWLVTGNESLAARLTLGAWRRSMGSLQDLRGPDVLEGRMLRSIVAGATRAGLMRRPAPGPGLETAWLRLPPRTRAALVLLHEQGLDPRRVADILECSDAALAALETRGLAGLSKRLSEPDVEAQLARWLRQRAEDAPAAPAESPRMRHRVGVRRVATVAGAAFLAIALAAVAVAATAVAVRRANDPPDQTLEEDVVAPRDPALGRRVEDLRRGCPDASRLRTPPRRAAKEAAEIAVRFNDAVIRDDDRALRRLAEPSASPTHGRWASTKSRQGIIVTHAARVSNDDLFTVACGREITKKSVRVVMYDRNGVTSEGLAFFYVAYTGEGWRVWGADEPGA
ncbi:MAG: hypothetical protein ACRDK3_07425 [Actinomycetota bacterium]